MAVGGNAYPVGALIYAMSKYCAPNSDKGYSVGQKYVDYIEHTKLMLQAADGAEAAALKRLELIGRADDLLSIKGSSAYRRVGDECAGRRPSLAPSPGLLAHYSPLYLLGTQTKLFLLYENTPLLGVCSLVCLRVLCPWFVPRYIYIYTYRGMP